MAADVITFSAAISACQAHGLGDDKLTFLGIKIQCICNVYCEHFFVFVLTLCLAEKYM